MLRKKTTGMLPSARLIDGRSSSRHASLEAAQAPEHLVGVGFRCWMAGYQTGDINCWEVGWNHYASVLGPKQAKAAVTELACWVRSVRSRATRPIEVYPTHCTRFCRDEYIAISLIAAAQQNECPAMRACAFALIGDGLVDDVVDTAEDFACLLGGFGVRLQPASVTQAALLAARPNPTLPN